MASVSLPCGRGMKEEGVPQVMGEAPPPPESNAWPAVPAVVGRLKLKVPAADWADMVIVPLVCPFKQYAARGRVDLPEREISAAYAGIGIAGDDICAGRSGIISKQPSGSGIDRAGSRYRRPGSIARSVRFEELTT